MAVSLSVFREGLHVYIKVFRIHPEISESFETPDKPIRSPLPPHHASPCAPADALSGQLRP